MKIIILSILLTTQAQFIDYQSDTVDVSTRNYFSLSTQTVNQEMKEEDRTLSIESSTENIPDQFNPNETSTFIIFTNVSKSTEISSVFPSWKSDLDYTTLTNEILFTKEQWVNVNQSNTQDPYTFSIFWKKIDENSKDDSTYIIRSEGRCLDKMCHAKLKYNGSLSNKMEGCLSFILWTRGEPVGQIWIQEDEEQESISQKIQLSNSSLRVEHSLKSKIKNLSIDARILFRNSQIDVITLSNLNINWNGPCPQHHPIVTSLPEILLYQSTSENDLTSEDFTQASRLTTYDSEENITVESSTVQFDKKVLKQSSSSYLNETNIGWILSLIILFCLLIILCSVLYGLWSIRGHSRFSWYLKFDSPVQFLARRSISSSTRSDNKIKTLSQISQNLFTDSQFEYFDSFTLDSSRSTPSAFYTYF